VLLLLKVGHERGVRPLAVPPQAVADLDCVQRRVGTVKEHKQSP
jgi:hypothetical protein